MNIVRKNMIKRNERKKKTNKQTISRKEDLGIRRIKEDGKHKMNGDVQ